MQKILIYLIRIYRLLLSPHIGNQCRFTPSCSHYTEQALKEYGSLYGSYLGAKRIIRCGPWCEGGYDPIPLTKKLSKREINS